MTLSKVHRLLFELRHRIDGGYCLALCWSFMKAFANLSFRAPSCFENARKNYFVEFLKNTILAFVCVLAI